MAAKKKKSSRAKAGAKKGKKSAKRKVARKSAKRKAAPKRKAAAKKRPTVKKIAAKVAPAMDRMKTGVTEVGQGALDAGRMLFGEAKEAGKEAQDKVKEITTDWINRVT
jgi:hypothetical protein